MRIAVDAKTLSEEKKTGVEYYTSSVLSALLKLDQVNHYTLYVKDGADSGLVNQENVVVRVLNTPFLWTQVRLPLDFFGKNYNLFFFPTLSRPFVCPFRSVVTVHDLAFLISPDQVTKWDLFRLKLVARSSINNAAHLIAVSEATKKDIMRLFGVAEENITVVYNGYNSELFRPASKKAVSKVKSKFGLDKYLLYVGTLQKRKNIPRLLKAFNRLSDGSLQLVIVGKKGWLYSEIFETVERLGLRERVKFLGYVEERDLPALYSGAEMFVWPSLYEGFGIPLVEAQACGCPVVTSDVSSLPEVGGNGAYYVDPHNTEDIARGMEEMLRNKDLRLKLMEQGFENTKRFSWEKCASETLRIFLNIL